MNGLQVFCLRAWDKAENIAHLNFLLVFNIILNVIMSVTAALGNGMIIVPIFRSKNLQKPSFLLITSLAFTDLLVGLVYHPFQIAQNIFYLQKKVSEICQMWEFFGVTLFLGAVAFPTVTFISIDRYLALTLKHRYRVVVTKKRVYALIVMGWTIGIIGTPLIMVFHIHWLLGIEANVLTLSAGAICLVTTCIFYMLSFKNLRLFTAQVHTQQPNSLQPQFNVVQYKKSLKTMLFTFAVFFLSLVPLLCVILSLVSFEIANETFPFYMISLTFMGLNSSLNPIIYFTRFTDIRNACKQTLRKLTN